MISAMAQQVKAILDKYAQSDKDFANDYNNPQHGQSLEGFCKLLYESYRKTATGSSAAVFGNDEHLYGWAVHYFHEEGVTELDVSSDPLVCAKASTPKSSAPTTPAPKTPKPKETKTKTKTKTVALTPPTPQTTKPQNNQTTNDDFDFDDEEMITPVTPAATPVITPTADDDDDWDF